MLTLEDIEKICKTKEGTVNIEAWGGEVKIRQLTVAETAEVVKTQTAGDGAMSTIKMASFALVEPKMSVKKMLSLPAEAFEGIAEIVKAVGELQEPKK
ncbi:MAG: hypothetical protein JKY28_02690 [Sulfurimonas sp.]|nr:hypothetical protein [Sulfurimonas sp.]